MLVLNRLSERAVDATGGLLLHTRQEMRLDIQSDAGCAVAEALGHDFCADGRLQELRRVGVAQVVKAQVHPDAPHELELEARESFWAPESPVRCAQNGEVQPACAPRLSWCPVPCTISDAVCHRDHDPARSRGTRGFYHACECALSRLRSSSSTTWIVPGCPATCSYGTDTRSFIARHPLWR